jgi:hypothetical protein
MTVKLFRVLLAAALLALALPSGALATKPGGTSATAPTGTISQVFVSSEELKAQGLIQPAGGTTSKRPGDRQWWCVSNCYYVQNVRRTGTNYSYVTSVAGWGPSTITLSLTRSVSNGYSANVGVSAQAVSAGVGFNVQYTQSVTYSNAVQVPWGQCWRITAYDTFGIYAYDVMFNPFFGDAYRAGYGNAWNFTGIYYTLNYC